MTDDLVQLAVRRLPLASACLSRSLVLWALLRAQGVDSELRFGVRRVGDDLEAHAWVEHQGRPLNDAGDVDLHFGTVPLPPT